MLGSLLDDWKRDKKSLNKVSERNPRDKVTLELRRRRTRSFEDSISSYRNKKQKRKKKKKLDKKTKSDKLRIKGNVQKTF